VAAASKAKAATAKTFFKTLCKRTLDSPLNEQTENREQATDNRVSSSRFQV
jgi:hypothetical protein